MHSIARVIGLIIFTVFPTISLYHYYGLVKTFCAENSLASTTYIVTCTLLGHSAPKMAALKVGDSFPESVEFS